MRAVVFVKLGLQGNACIMQLYTQLKADNGLSLFPSMQRSLSSFKFADLLGKGQHLRRNQPDTRACACVLNMYVSSTHIRICISMHMYAGCSQFPPFEPRSACQGTNEWANNPLKLLLVVAA